MAWGNHNSSAVTRGKLSISSPYDTTTLGNFELHDDGEESAGTMISQGDWVSCKLDVVQDVSAFRTGLADRSDGPMGCYFDDIQIVNVTGIDSSYGQGPTCSGVVLDDLKPPGVAGYSDSVISEFSTLLTAGRLFPNRLVTPTKLLSIEC